jgi:hypothetical protein
LKIISGILKKQDAFLFLLIFVPFLFCSDIQAQGLYEIRKGYTNSNSFSKLNLENEILNDTSKKNTGSDKFKMRKSPWKALLYSAILPGAGQFYNESYWKIPVIAVIGGYLGYVIIRNNNKFIDYRDLYANSQTSENPEGNLIYKEYREFYRNQRDQFILYFGFLYLINLVDAYVDAQLFDFDVSDKVKFKLSINTSLNLNVNF